MVYPDRLRWAGQVLEVMSDDCYRISRLPAAPRVVDVGANVGTLTLAVKWHRPDARLVSIEPAPANLTYLERNLAAAGGGSVTLVKAAAGAQRGVTRLGGAFTDSYQTGLDQGTDVAVIPLSEVLQEPTALLKIDVEGAEMEALKGAGEALDRVERVAVEYHDYPGQPSLLPELLQLLKTAGFTRLEVDSLRRFPVTGGNLPVACCLVHGWRESGGGVA
jgi:FkbM family methyltransferase